MHQDVETISAPDSRVQALLKPTESGLWQLVRFGVVGGVATVADYAVMLAVYSALGASESWSVAAGYAFGLIVCYILSIIWIFPHRNIKDKRVEFVAFMLIGVIGYVLTAVIVKVCLLALGALPAALTTKLAVYTANLLSACHMKSPAVSDPRFVGALLLVIAKGVAIVLVFFFNFWSRKALLFSKQAGR